MGAFSLPTSGAATQAPDTLNNPILREIDEAAKNAHAQLSPQAQEALRRAGAPVPGNTTPPPLAPIRGPQAAPPPISMSPPDLRTSAPIKPIIGNPPFLNIAPPLGTPSPTRPILSNPNSPAIAAPAPYIGAQQPIPPMPPPGRISMTPPPTSLETAQQRERDQATQGTFPGIHNKVGRTFATIGDIVAATLAPRAEQLIPGSAGNQNIKLAHAQQQVAAEENAQNELSKRGLEQAQAQEHQALAQSYQEQGKRAPKGNFITVGPDGLYDAENKVWIREPSQKELTTEIDPEIGAKLGIAPKTDGTYSVPNSALGSLLKPKEPKQPATLVEKAIADNPNATATEIQKMLVDQGLKTEVKSIQVAGKPHQVLINSETGDTIRDLGESGEKPPVVNVNANEKPGKALLDKAEGTYRTAQQSANDLRNFTSMAQAGNKVTAQAIPLEGTLAIVTSQGVKRINRTEVETNKAAGSLFDNIMGEVGKLKEGQPVPGDILKDWNKLADMMEKSSYSYYKGAFDSAKKRYGLKDEEPLPEPKGGNATAGMINVQIPGQEPGQIHASQKEAFLQKYPNAKVLP